jgi:hypothetical protein
MAKERNQPPQRPTPPEQRPNPKPQGMPREKGSNNMPTYQNPPPPPPKRKD